MSLVVNFIVPGMKYFLGVFSGSLARLADAVHSSADVVSSAAIWAGIRLCRRKTKRFPFGLYKVENLAAPITALLILLAGYEKGIRVSEWLISQGVDEVVVAKSFAHKGPYYVFADAGVRMRQTEDKDPDHIKTRPAAPAAPVTS